MSYTALPNDPDARAIVAERLWRYIDKREGECWQWTGHTASGYGSVTVARRSKLAHRLVYEMHRGPIPAGLVIDHLCRNTLCVNPDHLEPVTHRENMLRGHTVSARAARVTHCPAGHAYDEANTYRNPKGRRSCRRCGVAKTASYRARKREAAGAQLPRTP